MDGGFVWRQPGIGGVLLEEGGVPREGQSLLFFLISGLVGVRATTTRASSPGICSKGRHGGEVTSARREELTQALRGRWKIIFSISPRCYGPTFPRCGRGAPLRECRGGVDVR